MNGERVYSIDPVYLEPGEYALINGEWYGCTPDGRLAGLRLHNVVEHDDGKITVSPSILVSGGGKSGSWHGYLENGVWREI